MNFGVSYSAEARQDYEYIAHELLAPETAAGQTERIMKPVLLLVLYVLCMVVDI